MNQLQQREIADGLRTGDPAAWRAVFREYAPQVWRFVARRMEGKAAAGIADVVQETMMSAARAAAAYDSERGSLWNWLRGIAKKQIALAYRTDARQDVLKRAADELLQSGGRLARWLDDTSELPEDFLARAETVQLVRGALNQLPVDYGDLLTAKYLDEMSVEQIATLRGSTATSVQSKLARARQAFRDIFDTTDSETF